MANQSSKQPSDRRKVSNARFALLVAIIPVALFIGAILIKL